MADTLIEVNCITKDYEMGSAGVFKALKGISLKVEKENLLQ